MEINKSPWPYAAVASAVGLTFVLKAAVEARVGPGPPFLLYLPVVTYGAWLGGVGPGLLATAMAAAICVYAHLPPIGVFSLESPNDRFRLVVFLVEGLLLSGLMEMLHVARRRAEANAREAGRYQEELALSEARLRAIVDNSPSAIFLKDPEGRYLLANRRVEVFAGATRDQLAGRLDADLFPRAAAEQFRSSDRTVLETGEAIQSEEILDEEDGPHTYLTHKFPLCDAAGAVYAIGGIATDITGRKRAEQALKDSEQRFRTFCQHAPIGIFLTDHEGHSTYTNPRCQEIYGFGAEEALGHGWSRFIHPEDRDGVLEQWLRLAPAGGEFSMEYRAMSPDGRMRWVHDRTAPLLSERGEVIGHVGTVEDVTERKCAEDALRRERDFAEGLIATARAIVLVLDGQGRVVRVNPFLEPMTGFHPDEACGDDWFDRFVPPVDRCRARESTLRALAGEAGEPVIYPILTRDGRARRVEWSNRALEGPGGDACVLAIGHDLTALDEAQHRALQAERLAAIGEMVAGLSHESRNALHRCQVCLEMLSFEVEDRLEALNLIARLQVAQDDLYRLYEDVRTYAAPIPLDLRDCDLAEVWREAWAHLEASRPGWAAELRESIDVDPHCVADPFRLGQVFRNILDNAVQAGPEPARVEVACTREELDGQPAIRVAVRDNGPGLGFEARRRIFEPFFTTKTRGTGLGMAIARRIVEAHGGRIAIGEGGGPGAEIIITLPRGLP
jgi:PAS domain S-box-containing protein